MPALTLRVSRLHRGVVFADFDNDGRIDAAVTSLNQPIELWMNRSPMQHWLQLKLKGTRKQCIGLGREGDLPNSTTHPDFICGQQRGIRISE